MVGNMPQAKPRCRIGGGMEEEPEGKRNETDLKT